VAVAFPAGKAVFSNAQADTKHRFARRTAKNGFAIFGSPTRPILKKKIAIKKVRFFKFY